MPPRSPARLIPRPDFDLGDDEPLPILAPGESPLVHPRPLVPGLIPGELSQAAIWPSAVSIWPLPAPLFPWP